MPFRVIFLLTAVILFDITHTKSTNEAESNVAISEPVNQEKDDLNAAASGYPERYSDWGRGYSSGYGVTGYGSLDDRYAGYSGYDSPYGSNGFDVDSSRYGNSGYSSGYGGNRGGYGGTYGGYGGYSGNGGLNSYYGYNNPYYQGANNHLGYGYYRRPGYGSIYNSGITPSLVTGYRGYSRK